MENRRRFERINSTNIAEFSPSTANAEVYAITKDISQEGACIFSEAYLEPGRYLKIKLREDEHVSTQARDAIVVWSKLNKDSLGPVYQVGLNLPQQ